MNSNNMQNQINRQQQLDNDNHLIDYHVPYLLKILIEKRHDSNNNNDNNDNLSRLKLYLDPQMLNYQILQTLIVKGFHIECDFFLYYLLDEQFHHLHFGHHQKHRCRISSCSSTTSTSSESSSTSSSSSSTSSPKYLAIKNDNDLQQALNYSLQSTNPLLYLVIDLVDFNQLLRMSFRSSSTNNHHLMKKQRKKDSTSSNNGDDYDDNQLSTKAAAATTTMDSGSKLLKYKVLSEWDIVTSSDIILAQTLTKTNSFILNQIDKLKQRAQIQHLRLQQATELSSTTTKNVKRKALMTATNSWLLAEAIYQYLMSNDDNNNNNRSEHEPISDIWPFLDQEGRVRCQRDFRIAIYRRSMDSTLRRIGWKHLLNVYPDDYTGQERIDFIRIRSETYYQMRNLWQQNRWSDPEVRNVCNMVRKDVRRTDRHHHFYCDPDHDNGCGDDDDFDDCLGQITDPANYSNYHINNENHGHSHSKSKSKTNSNVISLFNILVTYALNHRYRYCQGMSDLASPLLYVMKDESHAYIAFCALMQRLGENFSTDGLAISRKFHNLKQLLQHYDREFYHYLQQENAEELLFCYRWILLDLKREFPFDDVLEVLEVLWASIPPQSSSSSCQKTCDSKQTSSLNLMNLFDTDFIYVPNRNSSDNNNNNNNRKHHRQQETELLEKIIESQSIDDEQQNSSTKQLQERTKLKTIKFMPNMLSNDSQTTKQVLDSPSSPINDFQISSSSSQTSGRTSAPHPWDSPNLITKSRQNKFDFNICQQQQQIQSSSQKHYCDFDSFSGSSYDGDCEYDEDLMSNKSLIEQDADDSSDSKKPIIDDVSSTCSTFDSGIQRSNTITSYQDLTQNRWKETSTNSIRCHAYPISSSHCNGDCSDDDNDNDVEGISTPVDNRIEILSNLSVDHGYLTDGHPQNRFDYSQPSTSRLRSQSTPTFQSRVINCPPKAKQLLGYDPSFDDDYSDGSKTIVSTTSSPLQQQQTPDVRIIEAINEQFNNLSAKSVSEEMLNSTIKQMETLKVNSMTTSNHSSCSSSSSIELLPTPSEVLLMEQQDQLQRQKQFEEKLMEEDYPLISPEQLGSNDAFMLFICLTLLLQNRDHIIQNHLDRNEIQMYFDGLIRKHNVRSVLQDARHLFHSYLAEWRHRHRQHHNYQHNHQHSRSSSVTDERA